jgi:molecular chaperone GrpE
MRLQAEFENYRKRMDKERAVWQARAMEGLVLDLLPALDSFDRALADVGGEAPAPEAVIDGMKLVHKQLLDALSRNGVEPIEAFGESFDPNLHEAFASRPPGEGERAGSVVEEFVKGYRMGDRVIRATKAVVAAAPEDDESRGAGGPGEVDDASPEEV